LKKCPRCGIEKNPCGIENNIPGAVLKNVPGAVLKKMSIRVFWKNPCSIEGAVLKKIRAVLKNVPEA
jgi:hypothetical protein